MRPAPEGGFPAAGDTLSLSEHLSLFTQSVADVGLERSPPRRRPQRRSPGCVDGRARSGVGPLQRAPESCDPLPTDGLQAVGPLIKRSPTG